MTLWVTSSPSRSPRRSASSSRSAAPRASASLREVATFYVEIMRGIPILVLLFYVAFVGAPQLVAGWNWRSPWPIGLARQR